MATFSSTDFKSSQIPASNYLPPSSGSGDNIDNSFTADGVSPGTIDNAKEVWSVAEKAFSKALDVIVGGGGPGGYEATGEGYGPFSGGNVNVPDLDNLWDLIKPLIDRLRALTSVFWGAFDVAAELVEGAASGLGIVYTSAKYKDNQKLSEADAAPILHNMTKFSFDTPRTAYLKSISLRLGKDGHLYADHSWYDDGLNLIGLLLSYFSEIGAVGKIGLAVKSKGLAGTFKTVFNAAKSLSLKGLMDFARLIVKNFKSGGTWAEKFQNAARTVKGKTPISSKFSPISKDTLSQAGKEVGGVTKAATQASLDGIAKAVDTLPAAVKAELNNKVGKVAVPAARAGVKAAGVWLAKMAASTSISAGLCYGSLKYINETENKGWTEREIRKNALWQGYSFVLAVSGAKTLERALGLGFTTAFVISEASQYGLFTSLGGGGDNVFADTLHQVFKTGKYKEDKVLPGDEEPITQNTGGMIKGLNKRSKR